MSKKIIPQVLSTYCPNCDGRGYIRPVGVLDERSACLPCGGTGRASRKESASIVNICSAGFVDACSLGVMGGDITALDALEKVGALLEKVEVRECNMCEGTGKLEDPFEDASFENCTYCGATGKATSIELHGDVTMMFAQIKDLAAGLRAALAETKGDHRE